MKILIVDDSSFIVLVCRQVLEKMGHEVVGQAFDGNEAVALAEETQPDLVIMDIALPKKNGFEASEQIFSKLPNVQILAISALDEEWAHQKSQAAGCVGFLAKPFDAHQLIEYIEKISNSRGELKYG